MNSFVKKIFVTLMIIILYMFFVVNVEAEAKLTIDKFYYSGTQEGVAKIEKGFFERVIDSLSEIADYLLGIKTLAVRGVVVGWIEIMEIILTIIVQPEKDFVEVLLSGVSSMNSYTQAVVNVEKIIFNEIELFDVNIFK